MANLLDLGKIKLVWRGSYNAATAYEPDDLVEYGGSSYICIAPTTGNTGNLPTSTVYWSLMAKGAQARLTTTGDLLIHDGQAETRLPAGPADQTLISTGPGSVPTWRAPSSRPNETMAKLPRLNDWGGQHWVLPVIVNGGKQIKIMGRNVAGYALLAGYDWADFSRGPLSTVEVVPRLDADDFFTEVAVGGYAVYAITNKGYVYAGGYNGYGNLGHGDTTNRDHLRRIEHFVTTNPKSIAGLRVGYDNYWQYTCVFFLTSAGELFACGYGSDGQLGNGSTANQSLPVRVGTLTGMTGLTVSASLASLYAWNTAGQLWVWGRNAEGQLGLGDAVARSSPVLSTLTSISKVASAAGGYWNGTNHGSVAAMALALKTDGTVYAVGSNLGGSLGVGDANARNAWTLVAGGLNNVTDIALAGAGYTSSFALRTDGRVFAWGFNDRGTCATGDFTQRNAPVECALPTGMQGKITKIIGCGGSRYNAAFFLASDNRLAASGANNWGNHGASWYGFGAANGAQEVPLPAGVTVQDLRAGDNNYAEAGLASWLLATSGELYAAGYNGYGIVGDTSVRGVNGSFRPCMV